MPVKGFVAVLAVVASARASRSSSAALRVRGGNVPSRIPATPVSSTQPWQSSPTQHPPAQQPWQSAGAHAQQSTTAERQITDLSQRDSRVGFVRKVYAVLAVQLLVTAASALTFAGRPELVRAFATTPLGHFALGFAGVGSLLTFLGLVFFRPDGWNAGGLLTLFTGCEALLVGVFCSQFRASSVALVLLQTCAAVTGLTAYSFQKNPFRDLTIYGSTLGSAGLILIATGIAAMFTKSPVLDLAYSAFGALVFSFYIVYDTQRVVGGEHHSQQLNSRDWALGAMMLYMDMVNLFMFLMRLFGERE